MRSGWLIREARLRAGLTQTELAERTGRDRAVIARWEQEAVAPSMETLVDLVRACGFDLPLVLVPYDTGRDERLESNLKRSPERRLEQLLSELSSSGRKRG
jgi:transcriptional regulator with XRE-family HTH domain